MTTKGFQPMRLEVKADQEYVWDYNRNIRFSSNVDQVKFICTCGATKNVPYCDGSHAALSPKETSGDGT
jgi:CDGSH-type Zn-finger protein